MESTTFDGITRHLGRSLTRRSALRGLVAGAVAAVAGAAVLIPPSEAKRRRKKKTRKRRQQTGSQTPGTTGTQTPGTQTPGGQNQNQQLPPGSRCEVSAQCTAGYICEVPVNGSNSDRFCSGGPGAVCGAPNGDGDDTAPFCAVGHRCVASGGGFTCQATPEE